MCLGRMGSSSASRHTAAGSVLLVVLHEERQLLSVNLHLTSALCLPVLTDGSKIADLTNML
jgi:hypothetical protein